MVTHAYVLCDRERDSLSDFKDAEQSQSSQHADPKGCAWFDGGPHHLEDTANDYLHRHTDPVHSDPAEYIQCVCVTKNEVVSWENWGLRNFYYSRIQYRTLLSDTSSLL